MPTVREYAVRVLLSRPLTRAVRLNMHADTTHASNLLLVAEAAVHSFLTQVASALLVRRRRRYPVACTRVHEASFLHPHLVIEAADPATLELSQQRRSRRRLKKPSAADG